MLFKKLDGPIHGMNLLFKLKLGLKEFFLHSLTPCALAGTMDGKNWAISNATSAPPTPNPIHANAPFGSLGFIKCS
jgi:hypothetical protein